jgi:WD40 repeat protein
MQFSRDGTELACGCSDGVLRVWNVWTGEQPSLRGHWPGEAVIAVAYSNNNQQKDGVPLLASSSTDHTIRLWKNRKVQHRPRGPFSNEHEDKKKSPDASLQNVTIQIRDAGHAYALMFSPDDSYLVSGHHPQQQRRRRERNQLDEERHGDADENRQQPPNQQQPQNHLVPETIYLWSTDTGLQMRRLENAGMPVSFLHSSSQLADSPTEHRLLSTCAGESLKLWSLGGGKKKRGSGPERAQCLQRLFLEGYSTVMPVPTDLLSNDGDGLDLSIHSINTVNDIMVASIDGEDSFCVWNTGGHDCECVRNPKNCSCSDMDESMSSLGSNSSGRSKSSCKRIQHSFQNTSPYEIRFSNNCTKVASVDNFNRVKVWNVQSGRLLKTFVQQDSSSSLSSSRHTAGVDLLSNCSSSEHSPGSRGQGLPGGFPIHELAFCQDNTVAVVSRFYNEIHLFST